MRAMTMMLLALGAITTAAQAQSSGKTRPTIPAPEVVIPRQVPPGEATADSSSQAPVEPVSVQSSAAAPVVIAPTLGTGFGAETRYWTALQISGAVAAKDERPLPGEVATKVYDRYVQSFAHPIPEKFDRDSFQSSGGGGGGAH